MNTAAPKNPTQKSHSRLLEIDLLRFMAALSVMLFHYTFRGYSADHMSLIWFPHLARFFKYGYLGVELFFMISGFVILMTAWNRTPADFTISRVVRLYPAYWVCCTVTFIVSQVLSQGRFDVSFPEYLANLTMLNGFLEIPYVDGVYFTLLIELKFYIFIFLLLKMRRIQNIEFYLWGWLLISFCIPLHKFYFFSQVFVTQYTGFFIGGAVCYLIYIQGLHWSKLLLLGGSYVYTLYQSLEAARGLERYFHTPYNLNIVFLIITVFFIVFLTIACHKMIPLKSSRWVLLGYLTYPLYLIHQNIGFMIFNKLHMHINHYVLLAGTMGTMLVLAYGVNRFVEQKYSSAFKDFLKRIFKTSAAPKVRPVPC